MKKVKILKAAATAYLVVGILILLFSDTNPVYSFLSVVCFISSIGYYDIAEIKRKKVLLEEFDNHGTGND